MTSSTSRRVDSRWAMISVVRPAVNWATAASRRASVSGIDAGGGLVEHDEVGPPQPDPGEGEELGLAGGHSGSPGAEGAMDPARDQAVETDLGQRVLDVGVGRRRVEQRHVLPDRALEQLDLLRDERDPAAQLGHRDVGDRHPAERHGAARRLDEAEQQPGERRLAAAGAPDDPDRAAGGDVDVDVVEDRPLVAVVEARRRGTARRAVPAAETSSPDPRSSGSTASSSATRTIAPFAFCTVSSSWTSSSSGRDTNSTYWKSRNAVPSEIDAGADQAWR